MQQSRGWAHYAVHRRESHFSFIALAIFFASPNTLLLSSTRRPEQHILLFRRPLGTNPRTGLVDPEKARATREQYRRQYEEFCDPTEAHEAPETTATASDPVAVKESIAKPEVKAVPTDTAPADKHM